MVLTFRPFFAMTDLAARAAVLLAATLSRKLTFLLIFRCRCLGGAGPSHAGSEAPWACRKTRIAAAHRCTRAPQTDEVAKYTCHPHNPSLCRRGHHFGVHGGTLSPHLCLEGRLVPLAPSYFLFDLNQWTGRPM